MRFTQTDLKKMQANGKIRNYAVTEKSNSAPVLPRKIPAAITWLRWNLGYWCNEQAVKLEEEYRFHRERRYRSDFAIPALKVLLEYEGGIFMDRGGHNSPAGIQRDIDKYSLAQKEGWRVIRLTTINYKTVLQQLNELIKKV
jgi:very-short-patch-repair endonuclease